MGIFGPGALFLSPFLLIALLILVPAAVADAAVAGAVAVVVVLRVAGAVFVAFAVAVDGGYQTACGTGFHALTSRDSSAGRASD